MATGRVQQDLAFSQGNAQVYTVDLSQPALSVAKRVADYTGYSFTAVWTGSPQGKLEALVSNAGERSDQLVPPANWVTLGDGATLQIGQGTTPANSPAALSIILNSTGWAAVRWTPSGGSGSMTVQFDGVRR